MTDKHIGLYIDPKLFDALKAECDRRGVTVSKFMRDLLVCRLFAKSQTETERKTDE
jgi:hypothetical protein